MRLFTSPFALAIAAALALPALPSLAQTSAATDATDAATEGAEAATEANENDDRGAADPQSVMITLGTQATEIREILMSAGEVDAEAVEATERARELATQAVETTGILLPDDVDTQVTTTRRSDVETARDLFQTIEEALGERLEALAEGDAAAANKARLAALQSINELPEDVRFEGEVAEEDTPTDRPGGASPGTLQ